METYVERTAGGTDRWDDAEGFVQFDDGILRIQRNDQILGFYAAGQWIAIYQDSAKPMRVV